LNAHPDFRLNEFFAARSEGKVDQHPVPESKLHFRESWENELFGNGDGCYDDLETLQRFT